MGKRFRNDKERKAFLDNYRNIDNGWYLWKEDEDINRKMWRNDLIGFAFIAEEQLITRNWPETREQWEVLHWYIVTPDSKPFADYQASKTQVMEKLKEWDAG